MRVFVCACVRACVRVSHSACKLSVDAVSVCVCECECECV